MAFDEDPPVDPHHVDEQKALIMRDVTQMRDQMFDEGQGKAIKAIGFTLVGMYIVYRFLFKR